MTTRTDHDVQIENLALRTQATREMIRQIGVDPDTAEGQQLARVATDSEPLMSVRELRDRAEAMGLAETGSATDGDSFPPPPPSADRFAAHQAIEAAKPMDPREEFLRASMSQQAREAADRRALEAQAAGVARARGLLDTADLEKLIAEAREAGNFARASGLQLELERATASAVRTVLSEGETDPRALHPVQPEYDQETGLSRAALELLNDDEKPVMERITEARSQGWWSVASRLQEKVDRGELTIEESSSHEGDDQ